MVELNNIQTSDLVEELRRRERLSDLVDRLESEGGERAGAIKMMKALCKDLSPITREQLIDERRNENQVQLKDGKFSPTLPTIVFSEEQNIPIVAGMFGWLRNGGGRMMVYFGQGLSVVAVRAAPQQTTG